MSNVIHLRPNHDVQTALRNIADQIDRGEIEAENCTLIMGVDVFHVGAVDDGEAAQEAIFNMTFGVQKLMRPVVDYSLE